MIQPSHNNHAIKRQFKRRNLKCRIGIFLHNDFFFAEAVQISEGGLLIRCPHHVEAGTAIELHFMIPGRIDFLALKGRVIYKLAGRNEESASEIGIVFEGLSKEAKAIISEFVAHGA